MLLRLRDSDVGRTPGILGIRDFLFPIVDVEHVVTLSQTRGSAVSCSAMSVEDRFATLYQPPGPAASYSARGSGIEAKQFRKLCRRSTEWTAPVAGARRSAA